MGKGKRKKKNSKAERRRRLQADERTAQVALEKYLAVQEHTVLMMRNFEDDTIDTSTKDRKFRLSGSTLSYGDEAGGLWFAQQAAKAIRQANLFVLDPGQYAAYYREADIYTTEEVAKYPWHDPYERWQTSTDEAQDHMEKVIANGLTIPVPDPERWPFPSMWLSFGAGVPMTKLMMVSRLREESILGVGMEDAVLLGQLWAITDDGPLIAEAIQFNSTNPEMLVQGVCWSTTHVPISPDERGPGWRHPYDLNPWLCTALHSHLVSFKTFIVEKNWNPHQQRRLDGDVPPPPPAVERKPIPQPYYLVKLKSQTIEQGFRQAMPPRKRFEYQHQFKVRGHYRVRIKRGRLPMDDEARETLARRKYAIYTIAEPSSRHSAMLAERGVEPKRPWEWMAILESWVSDHTRGPENAPFVPSVRMA